MFTLPLKSGDPATALNSPHSIILTEKMAVKYFGTEPAIGKQFTDDRDRNFTVTGVMKDVPSNSHLIFDALIGNF